MFGSHGRIRRWNGVLSRSCRETRDAQRHGTILMLSAVTGAVCGMAETILEIGRTAGWWN